MDYELEVGAFIAGGNAMGHAIPLVEAEQYIAGLVLVNDWSARDMQAWEYQPLGPFLAKNFATSVSPWVVTLDALAPFRVPARVRDAADPAPLPYLQDERNARAGGFGITLEVWLQTAKMREAGERPCASRTVTSRACTGRWARCSRTMRATAATCARAILSPAAP